MEFVKMHGIGNDFVVIDGRNIDRDWASLAVALCDRHVGIGSDGLLLVQESKVADLRMAMFNPDGSEAEMCGNGIRCFARFALDRGLTRQTELAVETRAGIKHVVRQGERSFTVTMGTPRLAGREIPVDADLPSVVDYPLQLADRELSVTCVSMGNPHAVFFSAEHPDRFPLEQIGPQVEHHPFFPKRVNLEVAYIEGPRSIIARVWERGVGITLACGTGACAIAVAARLRGLTTERATVKLPGGELEVAWDGAGEVSMTGPAEYVFEGRWPEEPDAGC